jgi:hypothetical protein
MFLIRTSVKCRNMQESVLGCCLICLAVIDGYGWQWATGWSHQQQSRSHNWHCTTVLPVANIWTEGDKLCMLLSDPRYQAGTFCFPSLLSTSSPFSFLFFHFHLKYFSFCEVILQHPVARLVFPLIHCLTRKLVYTVLLVGHPGIASIVFWGC